MVASPHPLPADISNQPDVVVIEPFDGSDDLPDYLASGTVALVADTAPANVETLTELRWLQLNSAGYTQVEGHRLASRGVTVTNASGGQRRSDRRMVRAHDADLRARLHRPARSAT